MVWISGRNTGGSFTRGCSLNRDVSYEQTTIGDSGDCYGGGIRLY